MTTPSPQTSSEDAFAALLAKNPLLIRPGLDRVEQAYNVLKRPSAGVPSVLVAGTNGKGTTAAYLWRLLRAAGLKVGLYTSPHLVSFCERFQITDELPSEERLRQIQINMHRKLGQDLYESLSFFEVATLMAWQLFEEEGCSFIVNEVGMGGRLDATNISDPLLSIIVSIGHDHAEFLGHSLLEIAREKAGVMRPGRPVLLGETLDEKSIAGSEIRRLAELKSARLLTLASAPDLESNVGTVPYLRSNLSLALTAASYILGKEPAKQALSGLQTIAQPYAVRARFERLEYDGLPILLDVCHNVEGAVALMDALSERDVAQVFPAHQVVLMVSILRDKDVCGILDLLRGKFEHIVLFKSDSARSFSKGDLQERHQDLPWFEDFLDAWRFVKQSVEAKYLRVVCGSVRAVGEVLSKIESAPVASLRS